MMLSKDPNSFWYSDMEKGEGWNTEGWATPFSAFRWAIPHYCNYEGRAIYCDSDFIFRDDIAKLWNEKLQSGSVIAAKGDWRTCCMLIDCETIKGFLFPLNQLKRDSQLYRMQATFFERRNYLIQQFQTGNWNVVDGEGLSLDHPSIKALHYSDMATQICHKYSFPRLKAEGRKHWYDGPMYEHPRADLQELFDNQLIEAKENGYMPENYIPKVMYGPYKKESQAAYQGNQFGTGVAAR
jgi:hypothetical protein